MACSSEWKERHKFDTVQGSDKLPSNFRSIFCNRYRSVLGCTASVLAAAATSKCAAKYSNRDCKSSSSLRSTDPYRDRTLISNRSTEADIIQSIGLIVWTYTM